MEHDTFVTETDEKYEKLQSRKGIIIAFVVFSLVACLGFFVAWQTFVFFEVIVLISCLAVLLQKRKNGHSWKLEFENDVLTITNINSGESFCVYDIPASDFVITQTKKEIPLDYCSLVIKNTVFAFGGIRDCEQLKIYIEEHYTTGDGSLSPN